jgi:hypothetical protein
MIDVVVAVWAGEVSKSVRRRGTSNTEGLREIAAVRLFERLQPLLVTSSLPKVKAARHKPEQGSHGDPMLDPCLIMRTSL